MPDALPGLEFSLAEDIAKGRQQRARRRTIAAFVVLGVAVVVGILTVVLDWGWIAWIAALVIAAVALTVVSRQLSTVQRIGAAVAAVAVIVAGVLVVRIPPIAPHGWTVDEGVSLVAAHDGIAVTLDRGTHALRGRATTDGREVWTSSFFSSGRADWKQLGEDSLLLFDDDSKAAVISIADGKTKWQQDMPDQQPFTANDNVIVFSSDATTTGFDLRTGKKLWTHPGGATAGSGGQSGYNPRRWVPRSDWIAVDGGPNTSGRPVAVLDARTGRVAAAVHPKSSDFAIAGKTFVEFGYDEARRAAKGTALAGGRSWVSPFVRGSVTEVLDVIDGQARALYGNKAVYINPGNGHLREVEFKDDWSVNWFDGRVSGRYVVVEKRDYESKLEAEAVADTVTGELVSLEGRGRPVDLQIEQLSDDTAVAQTSVADAVGAESTRYTLIDDGAAQGQVSMPTAGGRGSFETAGRLFRSGRRIVALQKD
ncbi:putative pyrroloquinoline-quinone binding quinoprotein [Kribbella antiqua]|uniref:Putative pyrroloquinoline-quinone binding quinoprotein n=1 Tax=Kribbella antiqua TaxID=2512217 RepID=A0A4R2IHG7_9ACTN|nr:PQQ-binding-like beta-propeller repeat protein [Kribbella antiqua]TCO44381.1 putative pyrroloquinoline-quinone binding quinoprotein [Kribbella antiqua]